MKFKQRVCILFFVAVFSSLVKAEPQRVKYTKIVVDTNKNDFTLVKDEAVPSGDTIKKILIAIVVKNHAHSLPTFLATLETLECPSTTKKCDLW